MILRPVLSLSIFVALSVTGLPSALRAHEPTAHETTAHETASAAEPDTELGTELDTAPDTGLDEAAPTPIDAGAAAGTAVVGAATDMAAGDDADQDTSHAATPPADPYPDDPHLRVSLARGAFQRGDFDVLRPLLELLLIPDVVLEDRDERLEARQLLAVGFYFEAQQVHDAERRRALLEEARRHALALLREEPDFTLDPLTFPASVVELFEAVRQENAQELQALLDAREQSADVAHAFDLQTLYIERHVQERHYALNFFPFGVGQFQNGAPVKGTLFAVGQGLALALNVVSYWMVEHLRGPDGRYDTHGDVRGGQYAQALGWRRAQYGGLGLFAALYAWSMLDSVVHYEPYTVHIRTLDQPPAELGAPGPGAGVGPTLRVGWTWRW